MLCLWLLIFWTELPCNAITRCCCGGCHYCCCCTAAALPLLPLPPPLLHCCPTHPLPPHSLGCSERGAETIRHFLFDVAKMSGDWKMEDVLEEEMEKIRQQARFFRFLVQCCLKALYCSSWACDAVGGDGDASTAGGRGAQPCVGLLGRSVHKGGPSVFGGKLVWSPPHVSALALVSPRVPPWQVGREGHGTCVLPSSTGSRSTDALYKCAEQHALLA